MEINYHNKKIFMEKIRGGVNIFPKVTVIIKIIYQKFRSLPHQRGGNIETTELESR